MWVCVEIDADRREIPTLNALLFGNPGICRIVPP
jgi:hypothetical protein